MTAADPAADLIAAGAEALGRRLLPENARQLLDLAELLSTWAERTNLTGFRGAADIVRGLVLDALAMEQELPQAHRIADLGSGAGFPGLPLAILRPEAEIWLVDSRERRHHFQRAAVRTLRLTNVQAVRGRIEQLEPRPCGGVVAQALARPARAVRLALRWCEPGAWIAIPGGAQPPDPGVIGEVETEGSRSYRVPLSDRPRTLWLGRWRPVRS